MDAVITWVDTNDPKHIAKRNAILGRVGPPVDVPGVSLNEIELCLCSILKFAPFFRRLFLVTDDQVPDCLDRVIARFPEARDKIVLVDHRTIFAGNADLLPTFNSTSIETMLFRVPGLDEEYVYFNDDFCLIRPVAPEDFFKRGRPQLRGVWHNSLKLRAKAALQHWGLAKPPSKINRKSLMWRAAQLAGVGPRFFFNDHTPHPFRRSVQVAFDQSHPDLLRQNAGFRFRSPDQFNVAALADHLEIAARHADFVPPRLIYLSPGQRHDTPARVLHKIRYGMAKGHPFCCVQFLDASAPQMRDMVLNWLTRIVFDVAQPH